MKKFFLNVLERITANIIYSIGVVVMLTVIGIGIQYNKEYLWFLPVSIGLLLIILLLIVKAVFLHYKKTKARGDDKKEELIVNIQPTTLKADQLQDNDFISLTEVVSKLINEADTIGKSFAMTKDPAGVYNDIAGRIARYVDIWGKIPSSSLNKWVEIPKNLIMSSDLKNMASELWLTSNIYANYTGGPAYIDLAIKKDDLNKAIQGISSEGESLFVGH